MITLWYGFFVAGVSSIVLLTMMQAQSLVSLAVQNGLIHQPFSANILTKTQFILLALLEAPLLLAGVCSGYLLSLTTIGSHINVVETIILLLSLGIASCMSLIHCIKPARSFIQALAAHPQGNYSSSTLQHLLLFISLMQTPFIFCLVSVLISANKLDNGFLVVIAPLFVSLSCIGVLY